MKGEVIMRLKKNIKRGFVVISIYMIVTFCLFMAADRVERLEKQDFRNTNTSVALKFRLK